MLRLYCTVWDRYIQVLYLGRALRTKETLPEFLKWRRVTRHPLVFHGLTGSQRTPGFGASHCRPALQHPISASMIQEPAVQLASNPGSAQQPQTRSSPVPVEKRRHHIQLDECIRNFFVLHTPSILSYSLRLYLVSKRYKGKKKML